MSKANFLVGKIIKSILILIILSYIFFMMGNSVLYLTNPDEVFYAGTACEMARHNTWMVPYLFGQPQFEKPILTYWLIRAGFIMFGVTEFGARFFSSLFGIIGIAAIYLLGLLGYKDKKKAFVPALVLLSSGVYIGMARIILTDIIFSVFILLSLLSFYWGYEIRDRKVPGLLLFFVFSAFSVLTKGPLGFFIPFLIIFLFLAIRKELGFIFCKSCLWGFIVFIIISFPWYAFIIHKYGNSFIHEFFYNDHIRRIFEAEHKKSDTWYFYPASIFIGMFPWGIYTLASIFFLFKQIWKRNITKINLFAACWIFMVFILFQPAHSKLISYILPLFPALAMITGEFIYTAIINNNRRILNTLGLFTWFALILLPVGLLFCPSKYSGYLPERMLMYIYVIIYIIFLVSMLFLLIWRKYYFNMCSTVLAMLLVLLFVPLSYKNINMYMSTRDSSEYLLKNYSIENTVLCSKYFCRGVRYYTGKEVAVWGGGFFSPHPIPMLDSDEKVIEFLKCQPVTYCVLSKSSFLDLERITKEQFKMCLLKIIGEEYVARVENV